MDGLLKSDRLIRIEKDYLIKKLRVVYKMNSMQTNRKRNIFYDNNDADFFINAANTKYFLEDYGGAIQDYNKAIELNPDNASLYKLRGIANRKLKNNKDAINDYSKSIEPNPNDPQAYIFRADAMFVLGNNDGCRLDLDKAGELYASYT
jgi:tetratricopeptide (TPR) repeat protein